MIDIVKASPHVIFRCYEDITVLYNIFYKNYAIINSLGTDIFNYLSASDGADLCTIAKYIAQEYCVGYNEVYDDVLGFVDSLYQQNMVSIDDNFDEQAISGLLVPAENDIEGDIIKFLQGKHQIYSATFELTYACNERCVHCYAVSPDSLSQKIHLTLEKCKGIIDELREMNCFHLIFTGGDPFMFEGFIDLLKYARQQQFSFDIYTNGQAIANNPTIVDKISNLCPRTFYISLYGATAKTHDSITQTRGSFEKTILAIKLLKKANISIVLNVMTMRPNYPEVEMIIDLAKDLGVEYRIGLSIIRKNNGDSTPLKYFIDDTAIIKEVLQKSNNNIVSMDVGPSSVQSGLLCGAGTTSLCISPNGDVYPCVSLKRKFGSVFEESLYDIWNKPTKREFVYSLTLENTKKCMDCQFKECCPHCIGISEAECGDPFECNYCDKLVAQCLYQLKHMPDKKCD